MMTKWSVLILGVMTCISTVARAEHAGATVTEGCDRNPTCYARSLALELTSSQQAIRLPRVVDFAPGRVRVYSRSREKLQAIAERWKEHSDWSVITVDGYARASSRSVAMNVALGQRRAEKIRGYLIRYGVPADLVVAVGHGADAGAAAATVDLSIELCTHGHTCARVASPATSTAQR